MKAQLAGSPLRWASPGAFCCGLDSPCTSRRRSKLLAAQVCGLAHGALWRWAWTARAPGGDPEDIKAQADGPALIAYYEVGFGSPLRWVSPWCIMEWAWTARVPGGDQILMAAQLLVGQPSWRIFDGRPCALELKIQPMKYSPVMIGGPS